MARIELRIGDPSRAILLRAMVEAEGHRVVTRTPDVVFCDDLAAAEALSSRAPVIVTVTAPQIPDAVRAMRKGVYGYVLVPFQPGEACLMIHRALAAGVPEHDPAKRTLWEAERDHVLAVMRSCKNNQSKAARILGIGRNTLWRKVKSYEARANQPGTKELR